MRIAVGVILVTGICGGYVFALPVAHHHVISKDLDRTVDQMYNSYISISNDRANDNNKVDVISQQMYLDAPTHTRRQQKTKKTYLLVKSLRQRNKRYIS
ncbi:uncharacterized protein BDFB_004800, partial [Asbolus verrucosus]